MVRMLEQIRRLFGTGTLTGLGESQLLGRFVDHDDEAAFEAIVARHGPMVLGVCRRRLRDPNDIDDAFQATFLILIKKASILRDRDALGPWLHGVARRVASRARSAADHRSGQLLALGTAEAAPQGSGRDDLLTALDEEIERLPEAFRLPIVLCHLEGCSYEEAARRLQWSEGMVRGRLARGRERLRERLSHRGLAPAAVEQPADVAPSLPPALLLSTIKMAKHRAVSGAVPMAITTLVEGVSRAMILINPKTIVAGLLTLGLVVTGALVFSAQDSPLRPLKAEPPRTPKADAPPDLQIVRKSLKEWWDTLETLSFREENFVRGADGRRDDTKAFSRLDFALAPVNRFAYDLRSIKPVGSEILILKKRWDGQKYYRFQPASNDSKEIQFIVEVPQQEPRDRYDGEMSDVLWLIFPAGGRHSFAPFSSGTRLEVEQDPQHRYHVFIVDDKDREIRGELDPDHGWMPKRVQIGARNVYTATSFSLVAGHWFPVGGTRTTSTESGKSLTIPFEVTDLRVNQPIPASTFNLDAFPTLPVVKGRE